jgi:hypothetical protein
VDLQEREIRASIAPKDCSFVWSILTGHSYKDALRSLYDMFICDDQAIGTDNRPTSEYLVGDQVPCLITIVFRGLYLDSFYLDLHCGLIYARY